MKIDLKNKYFCHKANELIKIVGPTLDTKKYTAQQLIKIFARLGITSVDMECAIMWNTEVHYTIKVQMCSAIRKHIMEFAVKIWYDEFSMSY